MEVKCLYDELLPLHKIIENPKNPNQHSPEKNKLLADNIDYQGIRWPIIISKRSGFIVAGHGRLYAARLLNYESYPVVYQQFDTEAQEFEFLVADNKLAELSETDDDIVKETLLELTDAKAKMLGYENDGLLKLLDEKPSKVYKEEEFDENIKITHECPSCGYKW